MHHHVITYYTAPDTGSRQSMSYPIYVTLTLVCNHTTTATLLRGQGLETKLSSATVD